MADRSSGKPGSTPSTGSSSTRLGKLQPHPLVAALQPQLPAQTGATMLVGYPGTSDRGADYSRLYLTPQFDNYVDIRDEDIVHSQPLPAEHAPLGEVAVWIKDQAVLHHTQIASRQVQANMLQGEIGRAFLSGVHLALPTATGVPMFPTTPKCYVAALLETPETTPGTKMLP